MLGNHEEPWSAVRSDYFAAGITRYNRNLHSNNFSRASRFWTTLPASFIPVNYDLQKIICNVNRHLSPQSPFLYCPPSLITFLTLFYSQLKLCLSGFQTKSGIKYKYRFVTQLLSMVFAICRTTSLSLPPLFNVRCQIGEFISLQQFNILFLFRLKFSY